MRRILVTGANGQVGWELQRTLMTLGEVVAVDRAEMDLADPDSIRKCIREVRPGLIVNAAAYTAVDKAESESDLAAAVNAVAPGIIAEEAKRLDAALIHYSTDYVFDGAKPSAYTEEDAPNPVSVYGRSKLAGERAIREAGCPHLIFRTSWVYGARGKNFLLTILGLAEERPELRIVDDQVGAPTWSRHIAETTAQIVAQVSFPAAHFLSVAEKKGGTYHLTAGGQTTWFGFAQAILKANGRAAVSMRPIPSEQYPTPAKRPKNSILSNDKIATQFGLVQPHWLASLNACVAGLGQ